MKRHRVSIGTTAGALLAVLLLAPQPADGQAQTGTGIQAEGNARAKGAPFPRQLTVYDREGKVLRILGEPGFYTQPMFSPDGMRLAVVKVDSGGWSWGLSDSVRGAGADIWVFDILRGTSTRVTSDPAPESAPVWSPDASQIAFSTTRPGFDIVPTLLTYAGLYRKASDGTGSEDLLYQHTPGAGMTPRDWSLDGRFLSFDSGDVLYTLPLDGERKAIEFSREEFESLEARFSPDGRFLAYRSDETGRNEVFVRSIDPSSGLPAADGKWQVSNQGALGMVHWRGDGRELYYLAADGAVMAVEVTTTPAFKAGPEKLLFQAPSTIPLTSLTGLPGALGSISRDGQRFVFAVPLPPERKEITVEPETLAKYTGTYVQNRQFDYVVSLERGQLLIQAVGAEQHPLFAESETSFFFKATNGDLEFVKDKNGDVTHFVLYLGRRGSGIRIPRK
jgi:dipeptidyl aminopeptidase/acylaminoacyl peptidase